VNEWSPAEHAREKRRFIESRLLLRSVGMHAALIFAVTWLAGWFASWLLLVGGLRNMPLRYAFAFAFAYGAFMLCVRVWSDFMRNERGGGDPSAIDFPTFDGEGCFVAIVALLAGVVLGALFAVAGGLPLLLEVAFEVVFAGVVVRRAARKVVLGDWSGTLVRNTWMHALVVLLVLVSITGWLQHEVPDARTFAEAVRVLRAR
jgi:hypothetical protein